MKVICNKVTECDNDECHHHNRHDFRTTCMSDEVGCEWFPDDRGIYCIDDGVLIIGFEEEL